MRRMATLRRDTRAGARCWTIRQSGGRRVYAEIRARDQCSGGGFYPARIGGFGIAQLAGIVDLVAAKAEICCTRSNIVPMRNEVFSRTLLPNITKTLRLVVFVSQAHLGAGLDHGGVCLDLLPLGMDAAHCAGLPGLAGFVELVAVSGGPHGGGAFVSLDFVCPNLGQTSISSPLPKLLIGRKQRPAFVQRRAIGKPAVNGVSFSTRERPGGPIRAREAVSAP